MHPLLRTFMWYRRALALVLIQMSMCGGFVTLPQHTHRLLPALVPWGRITVSVVQDFRTDLLSLPYTKDTVGRTHVLGLDRLSTHVARVQPLWLSGSTAN
jgi:hypothetical protein